LDVLEELELWPKVRSLTRLAILRLNLLDEEARAQFQRGPIPQELQVLLRPTTTITALQK